MGIKGTILSFFVLSIYLTSIIGVGRYCCYCSHSSQYTFLGITSKCSCVEEIKHKDPNHHCICGAHLVSKVLDRSDCCAVKYFCLNADQNSSSEYIFTIIDNPDFKTIDLPAGYALSVLCPRIKTFQALFHRVTESIFVKNLQLIL